MTNEEYCGRLRMVVYTSTVNLHYHQILEAQFGLIDRCIRIAVLILAIVAAVLAVPQLDLLWPAFATAVASAVLAGVLNCVPVVEWQKKHDKMFHLWSDLRKEGVAEESKTCDGKLTSHHADRLTELVGKMESLHMMEPAAWRSLLLRCQLDQNEREWGAGIRSTDQIEKERERRLTLYATCQSSAAASGAASAADQG